MANEKLKEIEQKETHQKIKNWLLVIGIFMIAMGVLSIPGFGVSPKRDTNVFYAAADTGAFLNVTTMSIVIIGFLFIVIALMFGKK